MDPAKLVAGSVIPAALFAFVVFKILTGEGGRAPKIIALIIILILMAAAVGAWILIDRVP